MSITTTTRRSNRTPRDEAEAPPEKLAYVAAFSRPADKPEAIAVLDVDPDSGRYGSVAGFTELPHLGDELHHFGWNACSSALHPGGGPRPRRPPLPRRPGHPLVPDPQPGHRAGPQRACGHQGARRGRGRQAGRVLPAAHRALRSRRGVRLQFYPDGVGAWMAKLDVTPVGGLTFDERFFPEGEAFRGRRTHRSGSRAAMRPATPTASRPSRDRGALAGSRWPDHAGRITLAGARWPGPRRPGRAGGGRDGGPYQRPQCTTSSNGRRSGRARGLSGRSAGYPSAIR